MSKTRKISAEKERVLRETLSEKRSELLSKLRALKKNLRSAEDNSRKGDLVDQANAVEDPVHLQRMNDLSEQIATVDRVIARLNKGDFAGICSDCGNEIPENRLKAIPHAIRCKDCEELRETRKSFRHRENRPAYF